jgi:hypothetical protein
MEGEKMIIVTWKRTTSAGGKEWNYFYCDTIEEAEQFRKECETVNGNEVISIEEANG